MELQQVRDKILAQKRIHFFKSDNDKIYLYDAFSQNIFPIPESVKNFFDNTNDELFELSNPVNNEIEEKLKMIDINAMTPIAALQMINDLQEEIKKRES